MQNKPLLNSNIWRVSLNRQMVAVFDCCPENGAAEMILNSNLSFVPIFIDGMESDEQGLIANPRRSYYTTTIRKAADRAELTSVLRIATAIGGRRVISKHALPACSARQKFVYPGSRR